MKLDIINIGALGIIAYLGYKAFTQGIPAVEMAPTVMAPAVPTMVRRVVRRRVSA